MSKAKITVVLFTQWFPYNKHQEQSFLAEELLHLKSHFDRVIIVPKFVEGEMFDLPEGIEFDTSLAERIREISWATKFKLLTSLKFYREVVLHARQKVKTRFALSKGLSAYVARDWIIERFKDHKAPIIFYSFWMNSCTLGSLMSRGYLAQAKVVSRCHNFDIYGNADNNFYVPYFHYSYPRLDGVFPDSDQGAKYLLEKVPGIRLFPGIMGVSDPGILNKGSDDKTFRILSCAYVVARKRVELFAAALLQLVELDPTCKIEWYHIGEGPGFDALRSQLEEFPKDNIRFRLLGNKGHEELMEFYRTTPLDLFVNTSTHEGTPVSLMEAISFSIPLMVSACGGNLIMAEKGGGWHFPVESNERQIAEKLKEVMEFLSDSQRREEAKKRAHEVWDQNYNSERNYEIFCTQLKTLME